MRHKNTTYFIWIKRNKLEPAIIWKLVTCQRITSKKYLTSMGQHLSPRYDDTGQRIPSFDSCQMITTLISNGCVHYQFSCALKLARKYEIEHWSRSSKTINWSADSFQINHVTSMSWHMSPRYGHVILVSGYPVLTAVNWPFCECPIYKMWTCQDTPETPLPPFW